MKEEFLHYLWQNQLFNKQNLRTNSNEIVHVERIGYHNKNSGPDFLESKIQIGAELWVGSVEIHLKSSDWYVHNHESDSLYDNVILHVVWEDDIPVFRSNNTAVSTLEMKGLVSRQVLNNYQDLFQKTTSWIPCESQLGQIDPFIWLNWSERIYVERLEMKSQEIELLLSESVYDWEAVLFKLIARNFGLKVNGTAFFSLANTLEFSTVRKETNNVKNFEALLMGQAGLLSEKIEDPYYLELQEIFKFQKHKYKLEETTEKVQFFRLRPANFPTIRIAQLASLFSNQENLFQKLIRSNDIWEFYKLLETRASSYWDTHYVFGKETKKSVKKSTKSFIDLLLINTVIPLRFTYEKYLGNWDTDALFSIIQSIKPESNSIVEKYVELGVKVQSALDSQALLLLKNSYCNEQRCLECAIGLELLKRK